MSDVQRSSSTDSGIDRLTSAARALDKVQTGLKLVDTVLKLGEGAGLPLIPAVCSAARGVLQVVQASRIVINDVLSAAQRTIDVLELLQLMAKNVEHMDVTSRTCVEDRMRELQRLLEDVRSAVAAFGKKGWLRHALKVKRRNAFSQLDSEITAQLGLLLTFYKITRDAHIIDRLQAREYAVEAEVQRQVAERNAMGEAVDEDALENDSEVVRSIAVASGVSDTEFRSELLELGDEVRKGSEKVDQVLEMQRKVLEALSTNPPAPPPPPPQPVPIPRRRSRSFTAPAGLRLDGAPILRAGNIVKLSIAEQAASEASSLPGFTCKEMMFWLLVLLQLVLLFANNLLTPPASAGGGDGGGDCNTSGDGGVVAEGCGNQRGFAVAGLLATQLAQCMLKWEKFASLGHEVASLGRWLLAAVRCVRAGPARVRPAASRG